MILEELGRNPPDVTLDHIVKDLLSFFNGFECLHEAKRVIEKKCDIQKGPEHKCWSEDYIKRAWEETKSIDRKSVTRRHWARVIILQVVKSFVCDTCKQNAAQKNRDVTTDEQCCDMRRNSEGRSTQSNAEPQQTEQTKDTAKQQSGADSGATKRKCTDNAGSESLLSTSGERDDSKEVPKRRSLTRGDDGEWVREGSNKPNSQTVYIRIPFSVMAGNESPSSTDTKVTNDHPTYKLIDRVPYLTEIRKRKSYAMLYDNRTKNAAWVYEILNSETLKEEVERKDVFCVDKSIHPLFQTSKDLYPRPCPYV